ncbi:histidine kinase [Streptomyces sp. TRM S81-3]|uniref:Histidine kinase n=1 Tax=Streptomyces griseicoloratus TaxID=2752516 RepID=A0A926QRN9_9ACTN|nr:ATP-binding protein [Streptomyces griseicoloratus]MBD0422094.1 histidine kinase [Streptomyces griseicoloratus]
MSAPTALVQQHGLAWLEAVVGDGFARSLQEGLHRSAYGRARRTGGDCDAPVRLESVPAVRDHGDLVWRERRLLARTVHDELGTALSTAARRIEQHAAEPAACSHLDAAREALQQAIDITRRLTGGLHAQTVLPPLVEALEEFADTVGPGTAKVRFRATGDERLLADVCRRELFLAAREALHNALRHAGARQVTVTLRFTRRWAHLGVVDDGAGFDTAAVLAAGHRAPGLRSMADRVEDLGGRLTVESTPGEGTRVDVHLPLRPHP